MTASKYTLYVEGQDKAYFARKDAAVRNGEKSGQTFQVYSPSGAVVHEYTAPAADDQEPCPNCGGTVAHDPSCPAAQPHGDEDLIGVAEEEEDFDPAADPEPELSHKFDIGIMKDKIAKLLAKAEGTDNDAERDAFTAKAEKLMVQLGIDAAELEAAGQVKAEEIVEVHRDYSGGYAIVMVPFVASVAHGFGDLQILSGGRNSNRRTYIIGHKTDVELFGQLLDSLEAQAMSALWAWQKADPTRKGQSNNERFAGSKSFLLGFGETVGARLAESRREAKAEVEVSPGAELVLASKMDKVDAWKDNKYPKLGKGRGVSSRGYAGHMAGREAGRTADLGEKRVGGKRGELR